jgi:hypothetical protein
VWFFDNSFRFLNSATVSFVAFLSIGWEKRELARKRNRMDNGGLDFIIELKIWIQNNSNIFAFHRPAWYPRR